MYDMYFKKSEDIARNAHLIGCNIDVVEKLDEYLARRNRDCFTLFDAKSKTGLGCCTEPLLNEYVQEGILREPKARHLCPVHGIGLEIISANEAKCIDCDDTHLLDECETEMLYERIQDPVTWSNCEAATISISTDKTETLWWKDKKWLVEQSFKVLAFIIGLGTCLLTAFGLYLQHQNHISQPVSIIATPSSQGDQSLGTPAISSTSIEQPPALNVIATSTTAPPPTNERHPTATQSGH